MIINVFLWKNIFKKNHYIFKKKLKNGKTFENG